MSILKYKFEKYITKKEIILLILISTQGLEKRVQKVDLQRQNQLKTSPG